MNNETQGNNVQPTPMPANPNTTVTPTQIPASPSNVVNPTPVSTNPPVTNDQVNTTPSANQTTPVVQPQPAPVVQPQVTQASSLQPVVAQPQTPAPEPEAPVVPNLNQSEVTVVSVKKKKTSNFILIIIIILLIVFVFNIEKVIEYYDNYRQTGSITIPDDKSTDNLTGGYILIDDNSSSIKVENIRFYNFSKGSDSTLSFNYDPNKEYKNPESLGIYIELYNYDKDLLYKEMFNTHEVIEMGKIKTYTIQLDNGIYLDTHYALVKTYTEVEANSKDSMICNYVEGNLVYKHTYNFVNKALDNYEVEIEEVVSDNSELLLKNKYEELSTELGATYENNILKYKVDFSKEISDYTPLYPKNTTKYIIKNKEELKKWNCE